MNLRITTAEAPPALTLSPAQRAERRTLSKLADAAAYALRRHDAARTEEHRRDWADAYRHALGRFRRFARFASAEICFGTDAPTRPCTAIVSGFGERCADCSERAARERAAGRARGASVPRCQDGAPAR